MILRLIKPIESNSFFLFGARGVGKSTYLSYFCADKKVLWVDLLEPNEEDRFSRNPQELSEQIEAQKDSLEWVVLNEIQKVPKLLNIVHKQIEKNNIKFVLTGSSARKLKKEGVNLLAGRAFVYNLFPFTYTELKDKFDLNMVLKWGSLPKLEELKSDEEKKAFLSSYVLTYIKEEIWAEHVVRNLDPFRRFLEIAAQTNSEIVNFNNIARDTGTTDKTIKSYFSILEDTLTGFFLESYNKSVRKRQLKSPKFYFFDIGVKNALSRTLSLELKKGTYAYGKAFEHFVILEFIRNSEYLKNDYIFFYLKTKDGAEIDLIIERPGKTTILLEIKSTDHVDDRDTKVLENFKNEIANCELFCLSNDVNAKQIGNVQALYWKEGIKKILN